MKRWLGIAVAASMVLQLLSASAETFYTNETETQLTNGVVHRYMESYTTSGWQSIHVVEADLTTPYVYADILTHADGLGYAANVLKLAQQDGSVAAINGDFFARNAWDKASPVGLVVRDGVLQSTFSKEINGATVGFTADGTVLMDYIQTAVVFTAANGNSIAVKEINKYDSLKEPVLYTSAFSETTGGSYNNILEVVVVEDTVTEMRRNMDGVQVPKNGYVIRHLPEYNPFLTENVQVGDKVSLSVQTTLRIDNLKSAMGGGTLLVQNGEKCKLTHSINGTNPRTMAGTDANGTKLYLITVDGRSGNSAGLTMSGMQDLALELGLDTAINLDGGGSTTMVTRDPKSGTQAVNNTPSDGGLRTVPIGLQIKTDAPQGTAARLMIQSHDNFVFAGSTMRFWFDYALDTYGNPCAMPDGDVVWSSTGGSFSGNIFRAQTAGTADIAVQIGDAAGNTQVTVLDKPQTLYTVPRSIKEGESFWVFGKDEKGRTAEIPIEDCTVEAYAGYRKIAFGGAETVLYEQEEDTETFECLNGTTTHYPAAATGEYTLTTEKAISGTSSGKISFHFAKGEETQSCGMQFGTPKAVPKYAKYVSLYVYAPRENYQWLRLSGKNTAGETVRLTLSDSMEFCGWQRLYCALPSDLESIDGIYVVQNGKKVAADSYILIDDLAFSANANALPQIAVTETPVASAGEFSVTVTAETAERDTLYSGLYDAQLEKSITASGASAHIALGHKTASETDTSAFSVFTHGNTAGLTLAVQNGSITGADSSQWQKIKEYAANHENILLFLPCAVSALANRQDEVLLGILQEAGDKNIYIFQPGAGNGIETRDGITYVTVAGLAYTTGSVLRDQTDKLTYAEAVVREGKVQVGFRLVYE